MTALLIQNATHVLTMDDDRRELSGVDTLIEHGAISNIGPSLVAPAGAAIVSGRDCVVTPGLINTHHHLYQTLTRAVPGAQDALLFGWLQRLYPIWARFGPDEMRVSAMVGLAELALSGCTTTSDVSFWLGNTEYVCTSFLPYLSLSASSSATLDHTNWLRSWFLRFLLCMSGITM